MLKWLYASLGFWGSVFFTLTAFVLFIFWIAGMAGISTIRSTDRSKSMKLLLSVVVPPYPIIWLLVDMYQHKKRLGSKQ